MNFPYTLNDKNQFDFIIVGAGIIGLAITKELKCQYPGAKIIVIEKEGSVACHSSGRNSGVLHAGFYYTAESLKAKFTVAGNMAMKEFCQENNLQINECGKVVVAQNEDELDGINTLYNRGLTNGVDLAQIDEGELRSIEPNAKTFAKALYSPSTATVNPLEISDCLKKRLENDGVSFLFSDGYFKNGDDNTIVTNSGRRLTGGKIINCAGLYADKVAREYGFSRDYKIIPFKGIYLKYTGDEKPVRTNIYPLPNLKNPFLGVHYTVTADGHIKIGPTATPAFWRENYSGLESFSFREFFDIAITESILLMTNKFNFRSLAFEEMKKYWKPYYRSLAAGLVNSIDTSKFDEWTRPGIRAQLLNVHTNELVQDFVVEGDEKSVHVLNAVSPAFTCSFPFAEYVVNNYIFN